MVTAASVTLAQTDLSVCADLTSDTFDCRRGVQAAMAAIIFVYPRCRAAAATDGRLGGRAAVEAF